MLVGREGPLAVGTAALADAQGGRGRLLLLAGEAGIGKTTLAQAVAEQARAAGATVRTGACWEAEGLPPFTPQLDVGAAEATDAASATRAQARLFAEVVDALYTVAATRPQVVGDRRSQPAAPLAFSVLHCLPAGRTHEHSAATGTVMRPATFEGYATQASFKSVDILSIDHEVFRFFSLGR